FHYAVAIGDQYSMIPGCRRRLEDCRDKWNNVVNFGGFSFINTQSDYNTYGTK
ncbi:MAG: beta tubulin, partial [Clostridiales bacterium]|nr:beta tubulin [Clostridiales bacterium]